MVRLFKIPYAISLMAMVCAVCGAQSPADASTLHVYVNRIQIPVLVLSQYGRPMKPVPEASFRVSIDGQPDFKPSRVRLEGDDPLAVAVILDASDAGETTWRDLPKAVEKLLPALNPQDRLTLYGLDGCKAFRFLPEDAPPNATLVRAGVERALSMKAHVLVKGQVNTCTQGLSMADMVFYVAAKLSAFSGRRAIVTVGSGSASGIAGRMDQLKAMLNAESVVLLPVIHDTAYSSMPVPYLPHRGGTVGIVNPGMGATYATMAELSEYSGGRVAYIASHEFAGALADAVKTARGRYILEFPRPNALAAGHYRISVTDGHPRDFIRVSGVSVPVANAEEIAAARVAATVSRTTPDVDATKSASERALTAEPVVPAAIQVASPQIGASMPVTAPAVVTPAAAAAPDPTDITVDLKPSR